MSTVAWPSVALRDVIAHRKEFITIDDVETYHRPRVQLHAQGIVLRDAVPGALIKTKKQQVVRAGEFLVAEIDAKVGGFGIVPFHLDGAIVSSHYFLYGHKPDRLDNKYLGWFVKTPSFRQQVEAQGSTNYAAIRPDDVLGYEIPLPPLDEQGRIVARVEELAAKVEEARKLKEATRSEIRYLLPQSASSRYDAAVSRFGVERLDTLCHRITDGSHYTPHYVESGIPFISVKDITGGAIDFDAARRISEEEHCELTKRCKPERDDVLLTKIGTTGYAKVVDVDREFSIFVSLALLKIKKDRLMPRFAEHMLNSSRLKQIAKDGTRGVGNQNLVLKFIRDFPMPVPPLENQARIVEELDELRAKANAVEAISDETAAELGAMLPAILDKAFKGEL